MDVARLKFQSTHPLRGATGDTPRRAPNQIFQSTHPLRGATRWLRWLHQAEKRISIHAPLAGCDAPDRPPSAHGRPISIHAPLAGCDICGLLSLVCARISIHAPLAGCDKLQAFDAHIGNLFQSTHPLRGATAGMLILAAIVLISIHAPLAGCDGRYADTCRDCTDFNPRTPCGVRRCCRIKDYTIFIFQSTHPLRGATGRFSAREC